MSELSGIPKGFNSVSAYLIVEDAAKAIEFYQEAFGAEGGACLNAPDGSIMHAEVTIGNSTVMLSGENPQWRTQSAKTLGGSPVMMHIYCSNTDELFNKAVAAGCTVVSPVMDMFWGDRMGKVADPFGIQWGIATQTEIVEEDEMNRRAAEWMASMQQGQG